jgi:uncharacterized protein (TIGR02611 family)
VPEATPPATDDRQEPRAGFAERSIDRLAAAVAGLGDRRTQHIQRGWFFRISFAIAGFVVLAGGILMLVLPGPGLLVMAIGLAMLALEFNWAERLLVLTVERLHKTREMISRKRKPG